MTLSVILSSARRFGPLPRRVIVILLLYGRMRSAWREQLISLAQVQVNKANGQNADVNSATYSNGQTTEVSSGV